MNLYLGDDVLLNEFYEDGHGGFNYENHNNNNMLIY